VNFLHHDIHLDVEVGDDGVDVRQRSGRGLRGRGRRGSGDLLLDGGLPFEISGGGLLLIKELTGGHDVTTRGGGLLLGSFGGSNQGVEPLLEDLGIGGQKGDDVRWQEDQRRGGGGDRGVKPLLGGLDVGGRKGDDVRRSGERRRARGHYMTL
jgi:hypothetical protein